MPNPFRNKNVQSGPSEKEKNWGKVKFNPVQATDRAEPSTPWRVFKNGIIEKQNEDLHEAKALNMSTADAQKFVKEREANHRKSMMEAKRKEPTKWDDFGEPPAAEEKQHNKHMNNKEFKKDFVDYVKKNTKNNGKIDNRILNFHQNNLVRGIITKNVDLSKTNMNLGNIVKHLKGERKKQEIKNKKKSKKFSA